MRAPIPNHRRRSWIDARRELAAAEARTLAELRGTYRGPPTGWRNEPMQNVYPAYPILPAPTIEALMEYAYDPQIQIARTAEPILVQRWDLLLRRKHQRDEIIRLRLEVALQTLPALPPTIQRR